MSHRHYFATLASVLLAALALATIAANQVVQEDASLVSRQSRAALKRDLADAKLCRERHGEASFVRNLDGKLVCIPRSGPSIIENTEE